MSRKSIDTLGRSSVRLATPSSSVSHTMGPSKHSVGWALPKKCKINCGIGAESEQAASMSSKLTLMALNCGVGGTPPYYRPPLNSGVLPTCKNCEFNISLGPPLYCEDCCASNMRGHTGGTVVNILKPPNGFYRNNSNSSDDYILERKSSRRRKRSILKSQHLTDDELMDCGWERICCSKTEHLRRLCEEASFNIDKQYETTENKENQHSSKFCDLCMEMLQSNDNIDAATYKKFLDLICTPQKNAYCCYCGSLRKSLAQGKADDTANVESENTQDQTIIDRKEISLSEEQEKRTSAKNENKISRVSKDILNNILSNNDEKRESKMNEDQPSNTSIKKNSNGVSTVKNQNGVSTVKNQNGVSTVKNQNGVSTVKNQNGVSTVKNTNGVSTVQNPNEISTVKNQNGVSTVKNLNGISTVKNPNEISTVKNPNGVSTVKTPTSESRISNYNNDDMNPRLSYISNENIASEDELRSSSIIKRTSLVGDEEEVNDIDAGGRQSRISRGSAFDTSNPQDSPTRKSSTAKEAMLAANNTDDIASMNSLDNQQLSTRDVPKESYKSLGNRPSEKKSSTLRASANKPRDSLTKSEIRHSSTGKLQKFSAINNENDDNYLANDDDQQDIQEGITSSFDRNSLSEIDENRDYRNSASFEKKPASRDPPEIVGSQVIFKPLEEEHQFSILSKSAGKKGEAPVKSFSADIENRTENNSRYLAQRYGAESPSFESLVHFDSYQTFDERSTQASMSKMIISGELIHIKAHQIPSESIVAGIVQSPSSSRRRFIT